MVSENKLNYDELIIADPICGSGIESRLFHIAGTFIMEAAMMLTQTPPGMLRRKYGFFNAPFFSQVRLTLRLAHH